jgi:phospholipase C
MRYQYVAGSLVAAGFALSATLLSMSMTSCGSSSSSSSTPAPPTFSIGKVQHVVVIYQENWSFDALYSQFPGANGKAFGTAINQTSTLGTAYAHIPQPLTNNYSLDNVNFSNWAALNPPTATFNLASSPYSLTPDFVSSSTITGDIVHRFYIEQWQIDGGMNDRFMAWSDNPGLTLSAFDATTLPIGKLAAQYTLCDNFFHSAFGGSFLNHQFLISAQPPLYGTVANGNTPIATDLLTGYPPFAIQLAAASAPAVINFTFPAPVISPTQAALESAGFTPATPLFTEGNDWPTSLSGAGVNVTQDGQLLNATDAASATLGNGNYYAINTSYSPYWPFPTALANPNGPQAGQILPSGKFIPPQTHSTIGDLLTTAGVSWKWYSGGWDDAVAGNPDPNFQFHHQPFNYFVNYAPGTVGRTHLVDLNQITGDLDTNTLPAVSFVKMIGENNEHPGYTNVITGETAVANLVRQIQNSPEWDSTVIIITYDEHGGHWDHVAPPLIDAWGPGLRVPCVIISPFAKPGFVDHTQYETCSILSFIEQRWALGTIPLPAASGLVLGTGGTGRDATANPFSNAFQ